MGQCSGRHADAVDDPSTSDRSRAQSWSVRKSSPDMSKDAARARAELHVEASTPQQERSRALSFAGSSAAFNAGQPGSSGGWSSSGGDSRPSSAAKSVSSVTFSERSPSVREMSPGMQSIRLSPEQPEHDGGEDGEMYERMDSVRVDGSSTSGQTGESHAVYIADLDGEPSSLPQLPRRHPPFSTHELSRACQISRRSSKSACKGWTAAQT